MGRDKWTQIKNIQTALRSNWSNENQDEGQTRGLEQWRKSPPPPNNNPPQYNRRSAYGNTQRLPSDPGPHNGNGPWHNSSPPPPPGLPSSSYNQNYQGGQYQAGSGTQGYAAPATSGPYQGTNSQAYGPNQGYFPPQPPASYPPHNPAYQQQHMASTGQSYQGGQSAYPTRPQNTDQSAISSHSPPLDPRPGSQNPQDPNQSPNFPGQSYHPQSSGGGPRPGSQDPQDPNQSSNFPGQLYHPRSSGGSLSRTVTAPATLHCEHGYPRN